MKIAIIVDKSLPAGLIANTAAVPGVSLGEQFPGIVRETVYDADRVSHSGITSVSIPILSADQGRIREIVSAAQKDEDIKLTGFNKVAQKCVDYDDYINKLSKTANSDIQYSGISIAGSPKKIKSYTGSLPLPR